jgi:hypothetical protein
MGPAATTTHLLFPAARLSARSRERQGRLAAPATPARLRLVLDPPARSPGIGSYQETGQTMAPGRHTRPAGQSGMPATARNTDKRPANPRLTRPRSFRDDIVCPGCASPTRLPGDSSMAHSGEFGLKSEWRASASWSRRRISFSAVPGRLWVRPAILTRLRARTPCPVQVRALVVGASPQNSPAKPGLGRCRPGGCDPSRTAPRHAPTFQVEAGSRSAFRSRYRRGGIRPVHGNKDARRHPAVTLR